MSELTVSKIIIITFKIILFVICAWIIVHLFSLFGLFIGVGSFIWWLFYPKYTVCFSCRLKTAGSYCNLCKSTVDNTLGRHPKTFTSALANVALIFFATLLSSLIVFLEYKILTSVVHPTSPKTVTFVIPSESQYRVDEIFPLKIQLVGIEVPINAIQADIGFDKERLEAVEISTKDSFATVFLQKDINNDLGYIRLSGGLPNPGFNSPSGLFGTVYFKGKKAGLAQAYFLDTSLVLANDGKGTNVIKDFSTVSYLITPDELPLDEQEMQSQLVLSDILGVEDETNENQILLFENDSQSNVLGIEDTPQESIENEENIPFFEKIHELLTEIDLFILDRLAWLLSLFNIEI